jgi:hypothetical protein
MICHLRSRVAHYRNLLINAIDQIAPTLRRLQKNSDPEAEILAEAIVDSISNPNLRLRWEKPFLKSGLHKIVVDILCEHKTYTPVVHEVCTISFFLSLKVANS